METMLVLLLVGLLVGAVFGILQSSLQLADTVKGEADRELRIQRFVELCENTLNRLPPDAVISLRPPKGGGAAMQVLEITGARSPFDAATPGVMTITTETVANGSLGVRLGFEELPVNELPNARSRQNAARKIELGLLVDLGSVTWRVFDPQTQKWIDKWNEKVTAEELLRSGALNQMMQPTAPGPGTPGVPPGQGISLTAPDPLTGQPGQPGGAPAPQPSMSTSMYPRPPMLELQIADGAETPRPWIFWIPSSVAPQ